MRPDYKRLEERISGIKDHIKRKFPGTKFYFESDGKEYLNIPTEEKDDSDYEVNSDE